MSEREVQLVDLLKYMHAMCFVRGDEIQALIPKLASKALDAGYWSEAFRVFLYDGDASIEDMRVTLESHIVELGGTVELDEQVGELIEITYYLRKAMEQGEDALDIGHYLFEDFNNEWTLDGGPKHLHCDDLALTYYKWAYDYAEWMQGQEYADKMCEVTVAFKKLAQEWLDQYAVPSPFDRL